MGKTQADRIEEALLDYQVDRYDPARMLALIAAAIRQADDPERCAAMLRKGAEVQVLPDGPGRILIRLAFGDSAAVLAVMRAVVWEAEPEDPPAVGTDEHDELLVLAVVPSSALAALPRG